MWSSWSRRSRSYSGEMQSCGIYLKLRTTYIFSRYTTMFRNYLKVSLQIQKLMHKNWNSLLDTFRDTPQKCMRLKASPHSKRRLGYC